MAVLHLPLQITETGTLLMAVDDRDYMRSRIRMFILSGCSKYLTLPSPGIASLWTKITTIGPESSLLGKDVFTVSDRTRLEKKILAEVNIWLGTAGDVRSLEILGDPLEGRKDKNRYEKKKIHNGIKFTTRNSEFIYTFEFRYSGQKPTGLPVGNWNIKEVEYPVFPGK